MTFKNDNWTKVLTLLENVVLNVCVEEGLDSIKIVYGSIGNWIRGIRNKLWKTLF